MSTNPRNTVSQLKRLLGKKFSDPHVQADLGQFPFRVSAGPNGECLYDVSARGLWAADGGVAVGGLWQRGGSRCRALERQARPPPL